MASFPSPATVAPAIVIDRDVVVPMRDGVVLRADIYRPGDDCGGPWPVLLERTPYDKRYYLTSGMPLDPLRAAERGYAVVIQDVRGRFASDGEFYPFINEADDGFDSVEWCAAQPWCDGGVALYGSSYMGATTWQAAVARPPHLKAIAPSQASSDYYEARTYRGGVPELGSLLTTCFLALGPGSVARLEISPDEQRSLLRDLRRLADDLEATAGTWPLSGLMDAWPAKFLAYLRDWLTHRTYDEFWRSISLEHRYRELEVPALHMTSWFDSFLDGSLRNFDGARRRSGQPQRLIVGPWTHHVPMAALLGSARVGDLNCGIGSMLDFDAVQLAWFDRWLKGIEETREAPAVRLFVMGANRWRNEDTWPPSSSSMKLYLSAGGALTEHAPTDMSHDRFVYDPRNPVPTLGGAHVLMNTSHPPGSFDQRRLEERDDVLLYTGEPLAADLEVIGWIRAELCVDSSAPDTDFTVKLVDVHPDGRAMNICDGIQRLWLRRDPTARSAYQPGSVLRVKIAMSATAYRFMRGHRVRLEVSSSNFPRFEPNLNTGANAFSSAESAVARQGIHHGGAHDSFLELPVVEIC